MTRILAKTEGVKKKTRKYCKYSLEAMETNFIRRAEGSPKGKKKKIIIIIKRIFFGRLKKKH